MTEENKQSQWHLDKTFSVSHLISTLAIAGAVFMWAMSMDTRVAVIEVEIQYAKTETVRMDSQWKDALKDIRESQIRIETKLDRKRDK